MRLAMAIHRIADEPRNVLVASLAGWGFVVAWAALDGVFRKFEADSVAWFTLAVALYAWVAYRMDREVHTFIQGYSRAKIVAVACLTMATLVLASLGHMRALAVFAAPLAAIATAAAVEKLSTRPTKEPGKSPVGSRAAT
jgi:hypothetical protein